MNSADHAARSERVWPSIVDILGGCCVVPVVVSNDPAIAAPLARALRDGGLPVAEITLRTSNALTLISEFEGTGVVAGAGTVLNAGQADAAIAAGARFLVSPGYSPEVNRVAFEADIPVLPGVATATEMMRALDEGHLLVKYFPAATNGGPSSLRALSAPLGALSFIPTGGITQASASSWLDIPSVIAIGGSWMVARDLLESANMSQITRLSHAASLLRATRGGIA